MKSPFLWSALVIPALFTLDQPRRQVPSHWQSELSAADGGQFRIDQAGDVTLKWVMVPLNRGTLELLPVAAGLENRTRRRSVDDIARRFAGETHRSVVAAVNGGFFDTSTGLPIGFLLKEGDMVFFNMPQGFPRSMVGFGRSISIVSPHEMPKVWLDTRRASLPVHHINIPGGRDAFGVFTPRYSGVFKRPAQSVYLVAHREPGMKRTYRIDGALPIAQKQAGPDQLVIALHGASRGWASALRPGSTVRLRWTLPERWRYRDIEHGLLAGPRLLDRGRLHVTAAEERLASLKSPDRMAIGVTAHGDAILLWAHKKHAANLSFEELAQHLSNLGAREGIALDGGHSRAILARAPEWDPSGRYFEGGRPVANAVLVATKTTEYATVYRGSARTE